MTLMAVLFWLATALVAYTYVGFPCWCCSAPGFDRGRTGPPTSRRR